MPIFRPFDVLAEPSLSACGHTLMQKRQAPIGSPDLANASDCTLFP